VLGLEPLPPPHPLDENSAAVTTAIHANGPICRHARWLEVRAFHVNNRVGKSKASEVSSTFRGANGLSGLRSPAAMVVTVLMVAMDACAPLVNITLEGRIEQVAYCAGVIGVQLSTTVPLKPLVGVTARL